jgi:hypothetical protein
MTINKHELKMIGESMRILFTKKQEHLILERFSTEPEPYVWSEQDIDVQIRNFLECGEFVKSMRCNGSSEVLSDQVELYGLKW